MDPKKFLKITFFFILFISLIVLFLPRSVAGIFATNIMLLSLFAAFLFSLKVGFSYERELRKVFLYLAIFIFFLFIVNIEQVWVILYNTFGEHSYISLIIAGIAYFLLIMSCFNIVKITDFTTIERKEWLATFVMFILGNFIVFHFLFKYEFEFNIETLTMILFRVLDIAIVLFLMSILFLYRKQSKIENKESITFTIVVIGIIISTIGDYIFEIFSKVSYTELSAGFHTGTLLDSIYIFSYMLIAIGLFVHLNYYKWSMKKIYIDKMELVFD